jgi:hypothetical protein
LKIRHSFVLHLMCQLPRITAQQPFRGYGFHLDPTPHLLGECTNEIHI